jgi:23S rRNA pseudouridine2605 synthase
LSAERLQKVLASAGIASRRDCEEYIAAGRVMVNGKVVRIPGTRVDPEHDEILVDGRPIGKIHHRTYVMLHKPAGVVSTTDDPQGRPTVIDLVNLEQRLFPVGRLDYDSEGLLLLTDDGELTQKLTHPSYQVEKEYRVLLNEAPSPAALRAWRTGVELDGVKTAPAWVELIERTPDGAWVRVILHEGRKRQIREVARVLGYEVRRLIRVREGPLTLGDLPSGTWRFLTDEEVDMLREHAERNAAVAEAEQPRRREQGETQVSGGRRLRRITPSARLLQKGDQVTDTTLPDLDEAVESVQPPPVVDERRSSRDNERIRHDERPPRDVRHSGRDGYGREQRDRRGSGDGRGDRRDERGGGYRERRDERGGGYRERREERGTSGPRDFRRDERGGGYRERREERGANGLRDFRRDERGGGYRERREERGANGPRDFRRDERGGGYRERREERGGNGPRDFRRDERGGGYRERREERGGNGPRDFRRDERSGGYRERREERGANGPRDFRRDERGGGYRERRDERGMSGPRDFRRDERGGGYRERREERGANGPRDFRRDERGGGYRERREERGANGPRDFRRDERGGGYRERRDERSGYRGERRNDRGSRGFSGNDRPAPRSLEEEEE